MTKEQEKKIVLELRKILSEDVVLSKEEEFFTEQVREAHKNFILKWNEGEDKFYRHCEKTVLVILSQKMVSLLAFVCF